MKKLLYLIVLLAVLLAVAAVWIFNTPSAQDALFKRGVTTAMNQGPSSFDGLRVVVCGSASPLGNTPDRAQACIAVLTPEHLFLFDAGAGSPVRINQARLPLARINGVFLTHYHSDHIAALPAVNLASWVQGRPGPLKIFGPAGVAEVVAGFNAAYKLDRGYRTAHHGAELLAPERGFMTANTIPTDGIVWQDDNLTITVFSVEHPPIQPAVGYRVDYRGRSVVISGDTNAAASLFEAAAGADLLLHDALSRTLLDPMIETASEAGSSPSASNGTSIRSQIMTDVITYHADVTTLPARAAAAGIQQLVLYHMVPAPPNALAAKMFLRDLPDGVILAQDLHTFDLPPGSTDIIVREP